MISEAILIKSSVLQLMYQDAQGVLWGRGGGVGSDSSRSPTECCVTLLMFTGLSHSWCVHPIILFTQKR